MNYVDAGCKAPPGSKNVNVNPACRVGAGSIDEEPSQEEELILSEVIFDAYPNPASNTLSIRVPEAAPVGSRISVLDIAGREHYFHEKVAGDIEKTVDIRQYRDGMYLVRLFTGKGYMHKKVLIVH